MSEENMTPAERVAAAQAEWDAAQAAKAEADEQAEDGREAVRIMRGSLEQGTTLPPSDVQAVTDAVLTGRGETLRVVAFPPEPEMGVASERWTLLGEGEELPKGGRELGTAAELFQGAWDHVQRMRGKAQAEDQREALLATDLDEVDGTTTLDADDVDFLRPLAAEMLDRMERDARVRLVGDVRKAADAIIRSGELQALADVSIAIARVRHPEDGREVLTGSLHRFDEPLPTGSVRVASLRRLLARGAELESLCATYGPDAGGVLANKDGRSTRSMHEMVVFRHVDEG